MIFSVTKPFEKRVDNWSSICDLINPCNDIRKTICYGCGKGILYDNDDRKYSVSRSNTVEQVTDLIKNIREINASI